jgi:uncharacterized protein with ATP-grasp and redox domains
MDERRGWMKAVLDCIPCMVTQAVNTAKIATDDPRKRKEIVDEALGYLKGISLDGSPAELSTPIYRIVERIVGNEDPYRDLKRRYNEIALSLYPDAKEMVERSRDRLLAAVKISVAGNIVDLGIGMRFDLVHVLSEVMDTPFSVDDYDILRERIEAARDVMIIGDNSGEIAFDRILVEELKGMGKEVIYVVKAGPIINDATLEDADMVGMSSLARVITTGSRMIGAPLSDVSGEFIEAFYGVDVVISKGHGNYETLDESKRDIFFLLRAKCDPVARSFGVKEKDMVLKFKGGM